MPIDSEAKKILAEHQGIPLVGLINKKTKEIVFAPCIPQKVHLSLDNDGAAQSGYFINDDFSKKGDCSDDDLKDINFLLKKGYVPRIANTYSNPLKSSHEFLYEQHGLTNKSDWGGFAVTVESTGALKYTFASGAFNSPLGQRIKGALLASDLQEEVKNQIDEHYAESLMQCSKNLTKTDLLDDQIYLESKATLAERIDFAWSVYSDENPKKGKEHEKALMFLIYAFDISDTRDVNQQLIALMAERQKYMTKNPEYIPRKQFESIDPRHGVLEKIDSDEITQRLAIKSRELLDLRSYYKHLFDPARARYLNKAERATFRVNIRSGLFEKNGKLFDTSSMTSKDKMEFAAYTINVNGELSVFSHDNGRSDIFHSSMNAGAPVVAAGELKIKNGALIEITTASGHYRPSLFNVYRALEYFWRNNVDISQTVVRTFSNPSSYLHNVTSTSIGGEGYLTPAAQVYKGINHLIIENVHSIKNEVETYIAGGGFLHKLLRLTSFGLTKKRAQLATEFAQAMELFKISLDGCGSKQIFDAKIDELEGIIKCYESKNNDLSIQYGKTKTSGRLAARMVNFKAQLSEIKEKSKHEEPVASPELIKNMKGLK